MLAIAFRVKSKIPVILMGETGCGKTSLIEFMCDMLDIELVKADVHGGFTESDVVRHANQAIEAAVANPAKNVWLFYDEVRVLNSG